MDLQEEEEEEKFCGMNQNTEKNRSHSSLFE